MSYGINDLIFKPALNLEDTEEAKLVLNNGYVIHVLRGKFATHTYGAPYEMWVTPVCKKIGDESIGYLSENELIQLINEIRNLPKLNTP